MGIGCTMPRTMTVDRDHAFTATFTPGAPSREIKVDSVNEFGPTARKAYGLVGACSPLSTANWKGHKPNPDEVSFTD